MSLQNLITLINLDISGHEFIKIFLSQNDYDNLFGISKVIFELKNKIKKIRLFNAFTSYDISYMDKKYNLCQKYYSNVEELTIDRLYGTIRIDSLSFLKKLKINYIFGKLIISNLPNLIELEISSFQSVCVLEISSIPNIEIVVLNDVKLVDNVQELKNATICNFNKVHFLSSGMNGLYLSHNFSQFKNVKTLYFNECSGLKNLNTLKQDTSLNLEEITLINCYDLYDISGIINLKNITISGCDNVKKPINLSSFPNVKFK